MSNELIASYVQHIPSDGYQCRTLQPLNLETGQEGERPQEQAALAWPQFAERTRHYQPMVDEPALLYKFADLGMSPDDADVLAFANRYGWLGLNQACISADALHEASAGVPQAVINGEFIIHWHRALSDLIPYLELWHAAAGKDLDYLRSVIHWDPELSAVTYGYRGLNSVLIASKAVDAELLATLTPGDVTTPAKVLLARVINQKMSEHCSPALLFGGATYKRAQLHFRCNSLLGVMWLQFAQVVADEIVHRRCVECSTPFLPSKSERGKKKRFCTDACKSRNYRNRVQNKLQSKKPRKRSRLH
jgi:hypothetical protein